MKLDAKANPTPRFSLRAKGMLVLVFPILALLAAVAAVLWLERETQSADQMVRRTVTVRAQIQAVRTLLFHAESGVLSYLISGESGSLEAYDRAAAQLPPATDRLATLVAAGHEPSQRMHAIAAGVAAEIDLLRRLSQATQTADRRELAVRARRGREDLRILLDGLQADVDHLFDVAGETRTLQYRQFAFVALVCGIAGPLGGLLINLLLTNRVIRRLRHVGRNAHHLATGQPLEPLPAGEDEVGALGRDLEEAAILLRAREKRLSASESRYRDLFNQAPVPLQESDREGVIRRVNLSECRLLGYDAASLVGRSKWEIVAPEHRDESRTRFLDAIASGKDPAPIERDCVLADGTRITVEMHESLIRGEQGEVTGMRTALLDVTEHMVAVMAARKVEEYAQQLRTKNAQLVSALGAAKAATQAKSRFLANLSHELRTPLNSIIGFSELMHDGKVGPVAEDHRDYLADILTSARHLLRLINDILDIAKIEAGKFEFRPEDCDLTSLAAEVCDVLRPLVDQKELELQTEFDAGLTGFLDPARFKQVLYNYLSNAVKFTPSGGRVILRVRAQEEDRVRIEVEDTGPGISEEYRTRLFGEFEQLADNRKADQGTGLGLAVTKRLVEAQGGRIGVRSTPGQGSLFFAVLPLAAAA